MQGEAASIELSVCPLTDITKSNHRMRRCVTCYNFMVVFGTIVPTVIKSIMKGNLRPGRHAKIQSMLDTLTMIWHNDMIFDNVDIG